MRLGRLKRWLPFKGCMLPACWILQVIRCCRFLQLAAHCCCCKTAQRARQVYSAHINRQRVLPPTRLRPRAHKRAALAVFVANDADNSQKRQLRNKAEKNEIVIKNTFVYFSSSLGFAVFNYHNFFCPSRWSHGRKKFKKKMEKNISTPNRHFSHRRWVLKSAAHSCCGSSLKTTEKIECAQQWRVLGLQQLQRGSKKLQQHAIDSINL